MEDLWVVLTRLDRQVQELRERQTMDETAYLMSTDANRKHLLQAIADVDEGKNMIDVPLASPAMPLSEAALAKDWNTPAEDLAWQSL
jgi:hypothetical protein